MYFWDAQRWPIELTTWKEHEGTVNRFRKEYGMDITVLLGGAAALNVTMQGPLKLRDVSKGGDIHKQLWSCKEKDIIHDHHPSQWTHDVVANALELAFVDVVLAMDKTKRKKIAHISNGTIAEHHSRHQNIHLHGHSQVSARYRAPVGYTTTYGAGGGKWRWEADFTVSLTAIRPQYGKSRNGAFAYFKPEIEEGAKADKTRLDRKIDESIFPCRVGAGNTSAPYSAPYRAYFGAPPLGMAWRAVELSLQQCHKTPKATLVVELLKRNSSVNTLRRAVSCNEPGFFSWSVKTHAIMLELNREVISFDKWTEELHMSACIDIEGPISHQIQKGAGLRWAVAFAG
jgi:hypothetical protein